MAKYMCEPKKREEIKAVAKWFRHRYGIEKYVYFPVLEIMDVFSLDNKVSFDIVDEDELDVNTLADTDIFNNVIRIKESVYQKACDGDGLARMTIVHEMGHYVLLKVFGILFARNTKDVKVRTCMDPEWQAKCFAGEAMIDDELTANMTVEEIKEQCGVSYPAARYQYDINHKND